jgi:hypothetical protein
LPCKKDWNEHEFRKWVSKTFGEDAVILNWTGGNSRQARTEAVKELERLIATHKWKEGEKFNIIAHSHGGNVAFEFSNSSVFDFPGSKFKIDTLVTLGTPIRDDYVPNEAHIKQHLNVYSQYDSVQTHGGRDIIISGNQINGQSGLDPITSFGEYGAAGRGIIGMGVENLNATTYTSTGKTQAHTDLWMNKAVWEKVVIPALKK